MPKHFTSPLLLKLPSLSKMKKAVSFLKQIGTVLAAVLKAKSMALKTKTSVIKSRLMIFGLLQNKKVLVVSAISNRIHALKGLGHHHKGGEAGPAAEDYSKAMVMYNYSAAKEEVPPSPGYMELLEYVEEDDDYPDLTDSLFDLELEDEDGLIENTCSSVVDLVRSSREHDGAEFNLEDEIDHVADVFIRRFRRQMRLQLT